MRTRFLPTIPLGLMIGLLGSTAIVPAWAQDQFPPAAVAAPAPDLRFTLPEPPPAPVVVALDDVTGTIRQSSNESAAASVGDVPFPPALPLDDQPVPVPGPLAKAVPTQTPIASPTPAPAAAAPQVGAVPSVSDAAIPTPAPDGAAPVAGASTPAHPPLDAQTIPAPPATTGEAVVAQGLTAVDLVAALTSFDADEPSGDTPAQAAERHKTRDAIVAYYAAHANAPLWIADGTLTPAARAVSARLDHAAEDGLDLRRFAVALPRTADTAVLARAELALSEAAVAYARQASGSRVDVAKLGGIIDMRPDVADAARVLDSVPKAADAGEVLHAFNPPQPGYAALREKLAELRQNSIGAEAHEPIPPGPTLRRGMIDARVPLIRARFGLDVARLDSGAPPLVYDTKVAAAVADFQKAHGLPVSGVLTPRTVAVLSGGHPTQLENAIIANMEAWRWAPRDLGADHIEVNIPDYSVRVLRDGLVTHQTRVVVGQPDKQTPVFSQTMKFIIVNPYWNVPLSIIKKEMMPKLAHDPNYFANHGYEVVERNGTTYVRQPPGDGNALGRIKFMFPNTHSVYLHDTNARSFFARDMRALSHGCVRVEEPFDFAEAVLGPENGWSEARIKKMIGGEERTINLPQPLPIHILYFTAFVDPQKGFQLRDDVYGYMGKVETALGLQG